MTAQESLAPASAVRRHKGYSKLYLDDAVRTTPGLKLEDGAFSPRDGVEFLYTVSSGANDARMTIMRLGMCAESSFVTCGASSSLATLVAGGIGDGLVVSEKAVDQISWNHMALFKAVPGALCVMGLVDLPWSPLRVRLCAREEIGYKLQTMICLGLR
jgi:hypothetical protein